MNIGSELHVVPENKIVPSKDKYAFFVALLGAILAFSAFKEALKGAHLTLGFGTVNVLQVGVVFAVTLTISAHFYALDYLVQESRFKDNGFFGIPLKIADGMYVLGIVAIPFGALLLWGLTELLRSLSPILHIRVVLPDAAEQVGQVITTLMAILIAAAGAWTYAKFKQRVRQNRTLDELTKVKVAQLEKVEQMYASGLYNSAVHELYKVVKTSIMEQLAKGDWYSELSGRSSTWLLAAALGEGIFTERHIKLFMDLKAIRNQAEHGLHSSKKDTDKAKALAQQLLNAISEYNTIKEQKAAAS